MRFKKLLAAVGAAALLASLGLVTAQSANAEDPAPHLAISAAATCASVTLTFTNNTEYQFAGDYQVGDEAPTHEDYYGLGPFYQIVNIPTNGHISKTVSFTEGTGDHTVAYRVALGAEQDWYLDWETVTVHTDCATAAVSVTPATCRTAEQLQWGAITHAKFSGTPDRTVGPGDYSVTATSDDSHQFPGGDATKTFTGTLADASHPGGFGAPYWIWEVTWGQPTPTSTGSPAFTKTSDGGLVKVTWDGVEKSVATTDYHLYPAMDASTNGSHLVYLFADGTRWTADLHADQNGCNLTVDWNKIAVTNVSPTEPTLHVKDVCSTQNDAVRVVSEPTEGVARYVVSWNKAHTTATVTGQAAEGYRFPGDATSQSWDVAMTNQPCPVVVKSVATADAQLANTGSDLSALWLMLGAGTLTAGIAFTVGGVASRRRRQLH